MKFIGPIQLEAKVSIACEAGTATVTYSFPPGQPVSEEMLLFAMGKCLLSTQQQLPDAELMPAFEFFNEVLIPEKTGKVGNFALPKHFEYDVQQLTAAAISAAKQAED